MRGRNWIQDLWGLGWDSSSVSVGACKTGQGYLQECAGLVRVSTEVGGIGQSICRNRMHSSTFVINGTTMSVKSFWFLCTSITNTANWEHFLPYQEGTTCSVCGTQCTSINIVSLLLPFIYFPLQKQIEKTSVTNSPHCWPDFCVHSPHQRNLHCQHQDRCSEYY